MNNKQETQAAIIPYIYLNKYIYHSNEGKIQGEYPSKFEQYETSNWSEYEMSFLYLK